MSESTSPAFAGCKRLTEQEVFAIIIGLSTTCGILITVFFIYLGYALHHKKRAHHAEQQLYALYAISSATLPLSRKKSSPAGRTQAKPAVPKHTGRPVAVEDAADSDIELNDV